MPWVKAFQAQLAGVMRSTNGSVWVGTRVDVAEERGLRGCSRVTPEVHRMGGRIRFRSALG